MGPGQPGLVGGLELDGILGPLEPKPFRENYSVTFCMLSTGDQLAYQDFYLFQHSCPAFLVNEVFTSKKQTHKPNPTVRTHTDIICFSVCLLFPSLFFSSSKLLSIAQQKQDLRLLEVSQKTETGAEKWFCAFIYPASLITYLKTSCFQNLNLLASFMELNLNLFS